MDTVLIDFEKAVKRQKLSSEFSQFQIDKIIEQLKADKNNLKTLKELTSSLIDSQKDLYTVFGKFVKNLEKQKLFKNDLNSQVWDPKAFENKEEVLLQTLATHFIREGRFKSYNKFVQESNLSSKNSLKDSFVDMYQILEAMKEKNLLPAIEWAKKNKSLLESKGSTLEFDLHRCKFIQLVVDNKSQEALSYAREFISPFHNSHPKEIQRLTCSVLYKNRLANSPYQDFLDPNLRTDLQRHFTRVFALSVGLSPESPLYISMTVGSLALPTIIKMSAIMKLSKGLEWSAAGELPVEIPLLNSQRYHSIFSCPVTKEQGSEENPPMMINCGHVVAKESLNRLSKGPSKFKCPYCPIESTASQAMRVYF